MILKFTSNSDCEHDVPSVHLLRDTSSGLVKRAGAKHLLKVAKTPNQEDLHVIALGAYEGTGKNRNFDAFREEYCRSNHHYFTKAGRAVHRHHKNKPSDPKFGNVKASAYNEDMRRIELVLGLDKDKCSDILDEQEKTGNTNWSMACVTDPKYPVLTNKGYRAIAEIAVGDTVLTHLGNWKKVTELCRSTYSGLVYTVELKNFGKMPGLTANHPLLFTYGSKLENQAAWTRVDKLKSGHSLFYRIPPEVDSRTDAKSRLALSLSARDKKYRSLLGSRLVTVDVCKVSEAYTKGIPVYNFEVEDDHSYLLGGVVSHNSKQAFDKCSICDHKSYTGKDRCEHIPAKLGEILEDGRDVFMDNPDPKWFEISYVRRPADRIGMSLGKVASVVRPPSTADYLQLYGDIYVPDDLCLSKKASDKRALLKKLSEIEKHVEAVAHGPAATSRDSFIQQHAAKLNSGPGLDPKAMDELRKADPVNVLKALADHGVIFTADDFTRYLFGNRLDKERVEGMKTRLPLAFSEAEQSDGAEVNNEKYEPAGHEVKDKGLRDLAKSHRAGHSLFGKPAVDRMMHSQPAKLRRSGVEQSKEASDIELASQYTAYKLAALNYLDEKGLADEDLLLNAVIQNRR